MAATSTLQSYVKPGAYVEFYDATSAAIHPLRTDVAGFVGIARQGPLDVPVLIESFRQFQTHFGGFTGAGYLAYAVRAFFENGGRRCWVVRIASRSGARPAKTASIHVFSAPLKPRFRIAAPSPGVWGNALTVALASVFPAQTASLVQPLSPRFLTVASVSGFQRGDLVQISQTDLPAPLYRVISFVDPLTKRLYWIHPERAAGLPYDQPLTGLNPDRSAQIASIAYTLDVYLAGRNIAHQSQLTLIPEHPRYAAALLQGPDYHLPWEQASRRPLINTDVVVEDLATAPDDITQPLQVQTGKRLALVDGTDGLANLSVQDFLGEPSSPGDSNAVRRSRTRGIRAILEVDEVSMVAVPDIVIQPAAEPVYDPPEIPVPNPCIVCPPQQPPTVIHQPPLSDEQPPVFSEEAIFQVQSALIQLCEERRDRVALLDAPVSTVQDEALGFAALLAWRTRFDSRHAALYYPWLRVVDPLGSQLTRLVPPSGHVAGQIARFDLNVGVHRAPANQLLGWAEDAAVAVNADRHAELNTIGINAIRVEPGRGLRILGARTLSSDASWRYLNVRRLVIMIIKAIDVATQWVVFEPNNESTRGRVTQSLVEFLTALWERGALVGPSSEAAFAVRCDETNNPAEARADGRLVADVAIAPSQPFEYVVLRVGRQGNSFEIEEKS